MSAEVVFGMMGLLTSSVQVLQAFEAISNAPHDIESMALEISALNGVLKAISGLLQSDDTAGATVIPANAIESCGRTLHDIMAIMGNLPAKSSFSKTFSQLRWILHRDKFQRLKKDLDRHKATFSVILSGYAR